MEKETELKKLVNVLRKTVRTAMQAEWTEGNGDTAAYCVDQYNRVFNRMKVLEPAVNGVFEPLPPESSVKVVAIACRQLAAWFEDDVREERIFGGAFAMEPENFKEFWRKGAGDIRDLGEFIRENIELWAGKRRGHCCPDEQTAESEQTSSTKETDSKD
ncbi:MAG: hypothetical protein QNK37_32165 [Acidobacteriota bacterium]|nr:hypothetical protein [Acidobacteriota bacterium]